MFNQNRKNPLRTTKGMRMLAVWLLFATLLLSGCRLLGEDAPGDGLEAEAAAPAATTAPEEAASPEPSNADAEPASTSPPQEEPTVAAEPTATDEPTATVEPTLEPTPEPTIEPTEEPSPTPLPPTATPEESATVEPESEAIQLEILVNTLRIRAGPSTDFEILSVGRDGELFEIVGRTAACDWMQIRFGADELGWVSSNFVLYPGPCEQFPIAGSEADENGSTTDAAPAPTVEAPVNELPTPEAGNEPASETAVDDNSSAADEDLLPSGEGCYLFQVRLEDAVTVTFTSQDRDWESTIQVEPNDDQVFCLEPGQYAFRLVAPPPWDEYTDELEVNAGDRYLFPIRPLE